MTMPKNIALIGYMGVGKTTVGRALSHELHYGFYDTDAIIAQTAGKTIETIFKEDGEPAFRKMETQTLKDILDTSHPKGCVIACGGGLPLSEENQKLLKDNCFTVELICADDVLADRLEKDENNVRPLLADAPTHEELLKKIGVMKLKRKAYYDAASDIKTETDILSLEDVIDSICIFAEMWQDRQERITES